ncbi:hypothetical protein LG293_17580 (plasmid) [Citricoccus nitrophenolicus]
MKDLHGHDIGTTLPFGFGYEPFAAQHPWPEDTLVSAGGSAHRGSYFLEAYPPAGGFLRGDGATPAEAEDRCWTNYQKLLVCPTGMGHLWRPDGYRNGVGVCTGCGSRETGIFTPEDLGQFCHTCGVAEFNTEIYTVTAADGTVTEVQLCHEHQLQERGTERVLSTQRIDLAEVKRASGGVDQPRAVALTFLMRRVQDDWDWLTDDMHEDDEESLGASISPTETAQAALVQVLVMLDPAGEQTTIEGTLRAGPLRDGGIRVLDTATGRRVDIDADGTVHDLSYDTGARTWTRTPIVERT